MIYLRTASGSFLKAENIVGLAPEHGENGKIVGWMAVSGDGSMTPLARVYGAPGRVERALPHLFPAPASTGSPSRRFIVPYTTNRPGFRAESGPPRSPRP
jgi:hypothetical protein